MDSAAGKYEAGSSSVGSGPDSKGVLEDDAGLMMLDSSGRPSGTGCRRPESLRCGGTVWEADGGVSD